MASGAVLLAGCAGFGSVFEAARAVPAAPAITPPTAPAAVPLMNSLRVSPFRSSSATFMAISLLPEECSGFLERLTVYSVP